MSDGRDQGPTLISPGKRAKKKSQPLTCGTSVSNSVATLSISGVPRAKRCRSKKQNKLNRRHLFIIPVPERRIYPGGRNLSVQMRH
jgi:hypothetical protein